MGCGLGWSRGPYGTEETSQPPRLLRAAEELLSTTLLSSLARGHGADHTAELLGCNDSRHSRPQTQPGMQAIGRSRGGAARQLRHLGAPAADLDGGTARQVWATAELLGTTRLGITDCGPFKGRVLWWSRGSYVPEQAPQLLRAADSDGAAGRTGRRSSMTSEAGHAGGTVTSDY